jgi:sugar-specific transcriptional regulator TrmB
MILSSKFDYMFSDKEINSLEDLGLTSSQVKVYLALLNVGCSNAKTASKFSGVVRQDIYRVLNELMDKGLVAKTLDVPSKFDPVSLEDGLVILYDRKKTDLINMQERVTELLKNLKGKKKNTDLNKEPLFEIQAINVGSELSGKEIIDAAKISLKTILPWEMFVKLSIIHSKKQKRALKRGVKIRVLTEKPVGKALEELEKANTMDPLLEIRYVPQISGLFSVVDNQTVFIQTETEDNCYEGKILKANNPSLVAIINDYYETMWEKTSETPIKKWWKKTLPKKSSINLP